MARERKTVDRWDIMANYGDGWTCECSEYSLAAAKEQLKTYCENCRVPIRLERHLEPVFRKYRVRMCVPQSVLDEMMEGRTSKNPGRYLIELQTPDRKHMIQFEVNRYDPPLGRIKGTKTKETLVTNSKETLVGTWDNLKTEFRHYIVEIVPAEPGVTDYSIEPIDENTPCDGWRIIKATTARRVYMAGLEVPQNLLKKIEGFLGAETKGEFQGKDSAITVSVETPDGTRIDIKCCGGDDQRSWMEAVLFENGCEINYMVQEESFVGEWRLVSDRTIYVIDVRPALVGNGLRVVPFTEDVPLRPGWEALC